MDKQPGLNEFQFVERSHVAECLGVSVRTLQRLAKKGEGPPPIRFGRYIYYLESDLSRWFLERREACRKGPSQ